MSHVFTLPMKLTNNNNGRGYSFWGKAKERENIEAFLRSQRLVRKPFSVPVEITVVRILGKGERLWDYSSGLRGNWKELEDALVACGWFHDDGPKWIRRCDFRQDDSDRSQGPAIRLLIEEIRGYELI